MKQIREKSLYFLFSMYALCKSDTSKGYKMYGIGKKLKYPKTETENIVEYLSSMDLIKYKKSSGRISITSKGIEVITS